MVLCVTVIMIMYFIINPRLLRSLPTLFPLTTYICLKDIYIFKNTLSLLCLYHEPHLKHTLYLIEIGHLMTVEETCFRCLRNIPKLFHVV